ncbi:MAG TPA: HypC/HybG/HupF family hydrogenase formation chaperone [Actinobacteria bacterium]|nr:HypC/HybG/HupF family hydrogenase formation chaperone [Actinomycetota bacterium]
MCVAVPARIKEIKNNSALISYMGLEREIDISLVPDAEIGDFVIVHAGFAIQIIDRNEAEKTLELFNEIEELEK